MSKRGWQTYIDRFKQDPQDTEALHNPGLPSLLLEGVDVLMYSPID